MNWHFHRLLEGCWSLILVEVKFDTKSPENDQTEMLLQNSPLFLHGPDGFISLIETEYTLFLVIFSKFTKVSQSTFPVKKRQGYEWRPGMCLEKKSILREIKSKLKQTNKQKRQRKRKHMLISQYYRLIQQLIT